MPRTPRLDLLAGLYFAFCFANAGCGSSTPQAPTPTPQSVTVSPASAQLSVGQTQQFSSAVTPAAAPQSVTWSVGSSSVGTVTSSGLFTAVGTGQTTVVALSSSPNITGTATVTVTAPPPASPPFIRANVFTVMNGPNYLGVDLQSIDVCTDSSCSTPIATASVTYDGIQLTYSPVKFKYTGNIAVAPGHTFNLSIGYGGFNYTASATQFTTFPTVTAPVSGSTWDAGLPNNTSWTSGSPTANATNFLGVVNGSGQIFYPAGGKPLEVPIGSTSYTIPPGWTSTPGDYYFYNGIGTPGIGNSGAAGLPISNAAAGSGVRVGGVFSFNLVHVF